jgi:hypothetical protein
MADWGTLAAESFNSAFEAARKRGAQKRETEAAIIIEDLKLKQKTQENKQQNQLDMLKAGFTPTQDNDPNNIDFNEMRWKPPYEAVTKVDPDTNDVQILGYVPKGSHVVIPKPPPAPKTRVLPAAQADFLSTYVGSMSQLKQMIDYVQKNNINTGLQNPKWWNNMTGKIAMQVAGSPEDAVFKQDALKFLASFVKAQSGVQYGFKELAMWSGAVPNPMELNKEQFLQTAQHALTFMEKRLATQTQILKDVGYTLPTADVIGGTFGVDYGSTPEGFTKKVGKYRIKKLTPTNPK